MQLKQQQKVMKVQSSRYTDSMQAGRSSNSQWVQSSPDRKRPDVMMDEGRAPERETINQYFP